MCAGFLDLMIEGGIGVGGGGLGCVGKRRLSVPHEMKKKRFSRE